MPKFPDVADVPRKKSGTVSVQARDFRGLARSATISAPKATDALVTAFADAVGNSTNAAVVRTVQSAYDEVINLASTDLVSYDESYSTTDHVMVMVFQDDAGQVETMEVPAPDLSMFLKDGETINPASSLVVSLITAAKGLLNSVEEGGEAGTFEYARGFLSTRSNRRQRQRTPIAITEPAAGDLPPAEPGT